VIDLDRRPSKRDLQWFGYILPVFFAALGASLRFKLGHPGAAWAAWGAGLALGTAYALVRALRFPLYRAWMRLFFPLGWTVSHAVLVVVFFGVVTPVALAMKLVRYDPMRRRFERSAATYWTERRAGGGLSRYLRQY
jgi:hypothetical protein